MNRSSFQFSARGLKEISPAKKYLAQFANADRSPVAAVFFSNEITVGGDGWAMITKFGDYPSTALFADGKGGMKKESAIQRVDKAGADAMVANFANSRKGFRKFIKGCNIYDGHPDVPGIGEFYPDKEPKGVFADLKVRDDGLYGLPVFTNEGSRLVENKLRRAFSGNIGNCEPCGTNAAGVAIYRPTAIFSAGLTNKPHLPVHFFNADNTLANEVNAPRALTPLAKKNTISLIRGGCREQMDISTPAARATFANEVMSAIAAEMKLSRNKNHTTIYNEAARRHPALFEGMQFKEIQLPGSKRK